MPLPLDSFTNVQLEFLLQGWEGGEGVRVYEWRARPGRDARSRACMSIGIHDQSTVVLVVVRSSRVVVAERAA